MSADFTPEKEDIKILPPFKMQVLTNFPYIEADFDALTNYQLLCKVVEYLNMVINNENEVTEEVTGLYNAYVSLQNYVNNYFDNLDVQEEINNKLDEMLEDGTLEQIIEQFLQSSAIWCYDNVASMKSATNLINGSYARTLGYYSVNDGGGATYRITNVVDSTIHQESLGDGLYASLIDNKEYINPEQLGAYGDGTHDDTTAIQECLTKYKNIELNKEYKITASLGNIANKHLTGTGTIYSYVESYLFNKIDESKIDYLKFINSNTVVDEDSLATGDFCVEIKHSDISHCRFEYFSSFSDYIHLVSNITFNYILYLNKIFVRELTDSMISNNYINAAKAAVTRTIMVRRSINNSSFNNNFVDYWKHCFRLGAGNRSSQIIGNTFDDCVTIFQDYVGGVTITGNTFSNIKYVSANWGDHQPPAEIQSGKWGIFIFTHTTATPEGQGACAMDNVVFSSNLARNCSYYFYVLNDNNAVPYLYGHCDFRGNTMFGCEDGADGGFIVTANMINTGKVIPPYFDFWDMKTYDALPSATLTGNGYNSRVRSFHGMHCFVPDSDVLEEYINVNGTWKKYTYAS